MLNGKAKLFRTSGRQAALRGASPQFPNPNSQIRIPKSEIANPNSQIGRFEKTPRSLALNPASDADLVEFLAACRPDVRKGSAFPGEAARSARLRRRSRACGIAAGTRERCTEKPSFSAHPGGKPHCVAQIPNSPIRIRRSEIRYPKSQIRNPKSPILTVSLLHRRSRP